MVVYGNGRQTSKFYNETTSKEFLHAVSEGLIAASDPLPRVCMATMTLDMARAPA